MFSPATPSGLRQRHGRTAAARRQPGRNDHGRQDSDGHSNRDTRATRHNGRRQQQRDESHEKDTATATATAMQSEGSRYHCASIDMCHWERHPWHHCHCRLFSTQHPNQPATPRPHPPPCPHRISFAAVVLHWGQQRVASGCKSIALLQTLRDANPGECIWSEGNRITRKSSCTTGRRKHSCPTTLKQIILIGSHWEEETVQ